VSSGNPFSAGFRAARANLIPGLLIQVLMVALVLLYYLFPPAHSWFQLLAAAKSQWGYAFSFCSAVLAGALLPVLLKCLTIQRGRLTRADLAELLFLCIFWGSDGVIIDAFYRFQAVIFGAQADFHVVLKKVLVDQFIYNPLFAAPYTIGCFEFKNQRYQWCRMRHVFTADFYRLQTIPALCATWAVWIPVTTAIYALPSLLQIPLFALAVTFWALLITYITSKPNAPQPLATTLPQVVPD
jgi:hypothetical protein